MVGGFGWLCVGDLYWLDVFDVIGLKCMVWIDEVFGWIGWGVEVILWVVLDFDYVLVFGVGYIDCVDVGFDFVVMWLVGMG